jgi:Tol biopolymer transport system component
MVQLLDTDFQTGQIAPSHDAQFICVKSLNSAESIYLFHKTEKGYERKAVFKNAAMNVSSNPWSPSGRSFVCYTPPCMLAPDAASKPHDDSSISEGSVIVLYNADENTSTPLSTPAGFSTHPVWSNDSSRIAFYFYPASDSQTFDVCVADVRTGDVETIARGILGRDDDDDEFKFMSCAWSARDTEIIVPQGSGFLIINLGERRPRRLPVEPEDPCLDPPPVRVYEPRLSPDGKLLAFCGTRSEKQVYGETRSDIWIISTADHQAKRLTRLPGDEYAPAWNSRSDRIAFLYGSDNCALIAGTVDLDKSVKWYPLDARQRLSLAKDYIILFEQYYDVMAEWKLKMEDALDEAMSLFKDVSNRERNIEGVKKLYDEVFKLLVEKTGQK